MRTLSIGAIVSTVLLAGVANADDLPTATTLQCITNCPNHVSAKRLTDPRPMYGRGADRSDEGVVLVDFNVGVDGKVHDPIIEQVFGSKIFTKNVLQSLEHARYEPAKENGKPVVENHRQNFVFQIHRPLGGARGEVSDAYDKAVHLAENDKTAAIASLREIAARSDLDLYEATMVADALAALETKTGDYANALEDARIATFEKCRFLDSRARESALRLRLELEARAGQFDEAFTAFADLKRLMHDLPADDPEAKTIADLHAEMDKPAPIWTNAYITGRNAMHFWQHALIRRSFGFADIKGNLDRFDLRCGTHGIRSPISDAAQWTVPEDWSDCTIYVFGAPESTFKFGEALPATVAQKS